MRHSLKIKTKKQKILNLDHCVLMFVMRSLSGEFEFIVEVWHNGKYWKKKRLVCTDIMLLQYAYCIHITYIHVWLIIQFSICMIEILCVSKMFPDPYIRPQLRTYNNVNFDNIHILFCTFFIILLFRIISHYIGIVIYICIQINNWNSDYTKIHKFGTYLFSAECKSHKFVGIQYIFFSINSI